MRSKPTYTHLTEDERDIVERLAKASGTSVSNFIRNAILAYVNPKADANGTLSPQNLEQELAALNNPLNTIFDNSEVSCKRERQVTVYFTDEEYEYVKKAAKNHSISFYIRHTLFRSGGGRFNFTIKTDDLDELTRQNEELNMHFIGFKDALQMRGQLGHADFAHCQKLLDEINQNTLELKNAVLKNRYSVRKQGLRELAKQFRAILKAVNVQTSEPTASPQNALAVDDDDDD